ncbi:flagellar hook-basal body complex protein FliE [Aliikangiella marina]|uniref:Flagellar hook-basal body complex protein FliE n=1 Tax=Aliikangiella marina TaxID=1712262 RepID=A0A545TDQ0_9GAMM|nr:flagellar hook-basal body complex protein FliE [Aliikangiella marina]TQV75330.1 flagellar hook-basal body complex protein FliE [Aliikangiella marina]
MKTGIDQNLILAQMQRLNQLAKSGSNVAPSSAVSETQGTTNQFGNVLTNAINTVNKYQQASSQAAASVETGDGGASLVKAVIASQKANVAFQATVQVRNRVVSAYQDIMNMPI